MPGKMLIGDRNQFHSGCIISAASIGDNNEFGAFCEVNRSTQIGNNCSVGVKVRIQPGAILEDQTNQFADDQSRRSTVKPTIHDKHLEYLYETLPKYHSL
jgi:bifunctional N-acetylglucosamine-1-phosphate-uridyltransferase/glucosamine-1-phosphate-acetyltransferase GlmU-like protein